MKSIKELVAKYGSQQKLAEAMGVHRPQVSRWVKLDAHIDEDGSAYIKTRSVKPVDGITNEWRDIAAKLLAVLQVNGIPLIGDYPERCLNEVRAEAVLRFAAEASVIHRYDVIELAKEYAERVKAGEQ